MSSEEKRAPESTDSPMEQAEKLIWSLLDDCIEPADAQRLETMMKDNPQVRQLYLDCVQMQSDLMNHFGTAPQVDPSKLPNSPVLGFLGDISPNVDSKPPVTE